MLNGSKRVNREAWLLSAANLFASELFAPAGFTVPANMRVSVGFPFGRRGGTTQHAIGQCWASECSGDGVYEVFISPELDDPTRAADVLIHEMVHAVVGLPAGHGRVFRKCATAVGLAGRMTATVASPALTTRLKELLTKLPAYPHRALVPAARSGPRKQGTRLLKIVCPGCGWTARTTAKWIDSLPTCGTCGVAILPAAELDGE